MNILRTSQIARSSRVRTAVCRQRASTQVEELLPPTDEVTLSGSGGLKTDALRAAADKAVYTATGLFPGLGAVVHFGGFLDAAWAGKAPQALCAATGMMTNIAGTAAMVTGLATRDTALVQSGVGMLVGSSLAAGFNALTR